MKKLSKKDLKLIKAGTNCGDYCPPKSICCNGRCIIPEHQIDQENCN